MRLSNFRIPSAVIGLTLMSGVAALFSEPFTYAQGAQVVAYEPTPDEINCISGSGVPGQPMLINPSCRPGGSHKKAKMCAKWSWIIQKENTPRSPRHNSRGVRTSV
jgi:hypothetical protein